jgi:hypothetical protein
MLRDAGVDARQLQTAWQRMAVRYEYALVLLAMLVQPAVIWVLNTRELRVSADGLELRYAWRWLDRWLGWRVPLGDLRHARLLLMRQGADPLLGVQLVVDSGAVRMWPPRRLRLSAWAPGAGRSGSAAGQDRLGEWPAPGRPVSRMDAFLMRPPELDDALCADLHARVARLPLGRVLRAHGVDVSAWPIGQAMPGQLDLARVPEFRGGLVALVLLALAGLAALVGLERWHFFAWPLGLNALLGAAFTALAAVALWPRRANVAKGVQGRAMRQGDMSPAARRESAVAVAFMAVLCGLLAAWLAMCGLLWVASRTQPATPQAFVLDKRHIETGPVVLRAQAPGVPDIHIDTQAGFWRRQDDGLALTLPVFRLGPWWMYDGEPLTALRR